MKPASRNGIGGSAGNVLETSLDDSPPEPTNSHLKRGDVTRTPGPRSAQRQFRSLLNLSVNPCINELPPDTITLPNKLCNILVIDR